MYIRKYDLMMISIIKQHGTFVHNYHCTFYITVVNGYMYMYMYIVYTVHVNVHTCNIHVCIYTVHMHCTYCTCIHVYLPTQCMYMYSILYTHYTLHVLVHTCRDFFRKKFQRGQIKPPEKTLYMYIHVCMFFY